MSVGLKGLYTPDPPEERDIAYLEVVHNGQTYDWQIFLPRGVNVAEYIETIESKIYAEIDAKEAEWEALEPKTRTEIDPFTGEETIIDIQKEEIVHPNIPDYYALRRKEYPPLSEQLDAFWKGPDSLAYQEMQQRILAVKAKYPKP